jgi:hypothetical protein
MLQPPGIDLSGNKCIGCPPVAEADHPEAQTGVCSCSIIVRYDNDVGAALEILPADRLFTGCAAAGRRWTADGD